MERRPGRRRDVLHAHPEAHRRRRLKYQQQSDGDDQPRQGVVSHGPEQRPLHHDSEPADEDQPEHHGEEVGVRLVRICEHHAVGAEHEQLAVGEVDHPHHAEDQHEPDRDQRHEARRVDGVDAGLQEQLDHRTGRRSAGSDRRQVIVPEDTRAEAIGRRPGSGPHSSPAHGRGPCGIRPATRRRTPGEAAGAYAPAKERSGSGGGRPEGRIPAPPFPVP